MHVTNRVLYHVLCNIRKYILKIKENSKNILRKIEKILQWIDKEGIKKSAFERKAGLSNGYLMNIKKSNSEVSPDKLKNILKEYPLLEDYLESDESSNVSPGDAIRRRKAIGQTDDEGLLFVPIGAQAGYALHYNDPLMERDLERIYIPNNPYKGQRYRFFEVDGDSMEPTLSSGMWIIAEKIDKDFWNSINDYYIHVIVKDTQILIKRLVKITDDRFAIISDNELYHQQELKLQEIKELWLVKRKLDWDMVPPKKFEVKIK